MGRMSRVARMMGVFLLAAVVALSNAACGSEDGTTQQTGSTGAETKASTKSTSTKTGRTRGTSTQAATVSTSQDDPPEAAQIRQQLIGNSINDPHLGKWTFEDDSEFVEFTIADQKASGNTLNYTVDVKLKDIGDGRLYNGELKITYQWMNGEWVITGVSGEYRSAGPSV